MDEIPRMLETAVAAAREAGAFLRESLGSRITIERKMGEFRNLVSEIDKRSEAMVIKAIRERYPDDGILAEESGGRGDGSPVRWIIDPLDGTTNFLEQMWINYYVDGGGLDEHGHRLELTDGLGDGDIVELLEGIVDFGRVAMVRRSDRC